MHANGLNLKLRSSGVRLCNFLHVQCQWLQVRIVPRDIRQPPHELFHKVFNGADYPAITRAMIWAPVQALHCPVPLRSPVVVWNCYSKLTRAAHKTAAMLEFVINIVCRPVKHLLLGWSADVLHKPLSPHLRALSGPRLEGQRAVQGGQLYSAVFASLGGRAHGNSAVRTRGQDPRSLV